jgi:hypothetical protein
MMRAMLMPIEMQDMTIAQKAILSALIGLDR